jgi:hypothetical protein
MFRRTLLLPSFGRNEWSFAVKLEIRTYRKIEIEVHSDNINMEEGFSLRKLWRPLFQSLKEREKVLCKDKRLIPSRFDIPLQPPFSGLLLLLHVFL